MKTLNDVINAVQHETQLSRSQLSLKIGKSRNYLNTTVKNGLSYEKEQEVIALLLDLVDDEVTMLRNQVKELRLHLNYNEEVIKEKEETIEDYKNRIKKVIDEKIDAIADKNKELKIKNLALSRNLEVNENLHNKIGELEKDLATKNLFIDGLDMENKGLMDRISDLEKDIRLTLDNEKSLQKTIESLAKAGHATGKQLNKEITKNRTITASIIGLVAIFSVYLWVK